LKGGSNAALSFWSDVPPQAIDTKLKAPANRLQNRNEISLPSAY